MIRSLRYDGYNNINNMGFLSKMKSLNSIDNL